MLPLPDGSFAAASKRAEQLAQQTGRIVTATVDQRELQAVILSFCANKLRDRATFLLYKKKPAFSALRRFTTPQLAILIGIATALVTACSLVNLYLVAAAISFAAMLFFLSIVALRLLVVMTPAKISNPERTRLTDEELPVYSVLVPLYHETEVLDRLLSCLANFDYPPDKLDIKIIIEQNDQETFAALSCYVLPQQFEVIIVPPGVPQTKPRALNYALQFAYGELLTIYDAEDLPSPRQLRHAAEKFHLGPANLACLQARLAIYNANENWLTRQFTLEYAMLFGEILPSLASLNLPLPLGGTSNHFRVAALNKVGGWDAFNVTEDADLGLRLARFGYRTATLDSDTFEEACVTRGAWNRQRARWLKGFLQTWLVHMREPLRSWRELGAGGFWVLQCMTIGVFVSALMHPLTLLYVVWHLSTGPHSGAGVGQISTWVSGLSLLTFAVGYGASLWLAARSIRRYALNGWWGALVTMPAYWVLMMPAAWLALYQFITDVHGWNKTQHGVSKLFAGD